jgi:signal transduction histidine kinase
LLLSMVGVTVVAVVLVAVPLAYLLDQVADDAARIRLERQAEGVALAVEDDLDAGRLPSGEEVDRLTPASDHTVVALEGVGTVDGGEPVAERTLRSEIRIAPGGTVEVLAPAEPVDDRVARAVKILLALALVATSIAAALAVIQGRRLARPLEALARTSRRVGRGDFSATAPRCGVREVDDVAAALDSTSARIGRLVRAEREFSANAGHQLRSALTGVSLHLEAMTAAEDPGVRLEANDALKQIDRLTDVIDELLRLAHVGRAGERREIDLAALASEHVGDWTERFVRDGRQLRLDAPASSPVMVTPGAAGQTLDVLLSNALVHGAGTTAVRVGADPASAEIVVTDEGRGIAPGERDRVFERADRTDAHGLGLALARQLVAADGGSLDLVGPAAFRIRFPVDARGAAQADARKDDQPVPDS